MTTTPPPPSPFDDQLALRLLHQRIVVVGGEIDDAVANRVCAQLVLLSAEDPTSDVALYINSPGGPATAGLAVYDTMRLLPGDVATVGFGVAADTGQLLLSAGSKGKRYALPHTRVRMHRSPGITGTAPDAAAAAEHAGYTTRVVHELLARHTGHTLEEVAADADRDSWFTATETLEYGMVDQIVESVEDVRPSAKGRKAGL
jgi:ATP-dependent Clp protease protease subunit